MKLGDLVWLFKEYRELYANYKAYEIAYEKTMNDYVNQIKKLEQQILDLEQQLAKKPVLDVTELAEQIFQEVPYANGRIPDNAWVSPGKDDRLVQ